jgi:hypothetical protein
MSRYARHGAPPTCPPAGPGRGERGAVTAELAVALPAVVLVLAALLLTASAATGTMRCAEGARAGARVAALGQSDVEIAAVVRRVAGDGSVTRVTREPPWVQVRVTRRLPGAWFTGGALSLASQATAWAEP